MPGYFKHKRSKKKGLPPGSLVYLGDRKSEPVDIELVIYGENHFEEYSYTDIEKCFEKVESVSNKYWININGIHNLEIVQFTGDHLKLHPLLLEDIVNVDQRPKIEEYDENKHYFMVTKMFYMENHNVRHEQVSFILGNNFLVTFQEQKGDVFDFVRERIRSGKGRIRYRSIDYLVYALVDSIVDNYFVILEDIGEKLETIENELLNPSNRKVLEKIYRLRRETILLRKSIWPLREVISKIERDEIFDAGISHYTRDIYDHTLYIIDNLETIRDILSTLQDMHLTSVSNRMNEVMKVLTIIATIFIPLTFIAGVYGMNFINMPELEWEYGYFYTLGVMFFAAMGMLYLFRRKGWF